MSEPMPGEVPAQQDGDAADPWRIAEPAEAELPLQAGESEATDVRTGPTGPAAQAEPAAQADPEGEQPGQDQPDAGDDEGPRPLGLHVEPTGHAPVDAQLRRLEDADHLAVSGHLEVYEDVHRGLRDTLSALDRPAPGPYPRS